MVCTICVLDVHLQPSIPRRLLERRDDDIKISLAYLGQWQRMGA